MALEIVGEVFGKVARAIFGSRNERLVRAYQETVEKINALEQIDKHIAAPLMEALLSHEGGGRILVLPDHPTPCELRTHTPEPVPFCMAGWGIVPDEVHHFSERGIDEIATAPIDGPRLMGHFLC